MLTVYIKKGGCKLAISFTYEKSPQTTDEPEDINIDIRSIDLSEGNLIQLLDTSIDLQECIRTCEDYLKDYEPDFEE